jgi:acetyl-CoA synthetase
MESTSSHSTVVPIVEASKAGAHLQGEEAYNAMYAKSVEDPQQFWGEQALELLTWDRPFDKVQQGSFQDGDLAWFTGGKLNVSVQCLDRHVEAHPDKVAIIWEADEPGESFAIATLSGQAITK